MPAKIGGAERKKMVEVLLREQGGKYTIDPAYDGSEYTGVYSKILLLCPAHGVFHMRAGNIAKGQGCPTCGSERRAKTTRHSNSALISVIKESDSRYAFIGFEDGVYVNRSTTKVIRNCPEHGSFSTLVGNVLSFHTGCPGCSTSGYDSNKTGYLYGLLSEDGGRIKIGITNSPTRRLTKLKRSLPFDWALLGVYKDTNGGVIQILEKYFHRQGESAGMTGFDGATEVLWASKELIAEFMILVESGRRPRGWRK